MAERRDVPRGTLAADPLVRALVACMREIAERRASERAEQRRRISVVNHPHDRGQAA